MSTHSFPKIDQKEYLKKYLSGDKTKKKKKDKKHKRSLSASVKVKIIDDDINHLDNGLEIDEELLLTGDDAPQIVGEYIEEKPTESKILKWKSITIKNEPDDGIEVASRQIESSSWARKAGDVRIKEKCSMDKSIANSSPDNSPPRRKEHKRRSPSSPARRREISTSPKKSKRNKSPSRRKNFESPDRNHRIKTKSQSPTNRRRDQSPARRQRSGENSFDASPPRRKRNFDQSPIRISKSPASKNRKENKYVEKSSKISSENERRWPDRVSNQSPTRKGRSPTRRRSPDLLPTYSDQSPPRKHKSLTGKERCHSTDYSPSRRRKDSYQSPRRTSKNSARREQRHTFQQSSPCRQRRDSDQSLSRRGESPTRIERKYSIDQSPPRLRGNSDQSPPRRDKSPNKSSCRRRKNSDQSPPRKNKIFSPPRKSRKSFDQSPPRRRQNSDQSSHRKSGSSPPRSRKRSPDLSPLRRSSKISPPSRIKREKLSPHISPPTSRRSRWERQEIENSLSPPPTHKPKPGKTLEGKKAGLQDAQALQKETLERRRREDLLFEKMSSEVSGRNAEIQVRSTGRKGRRAREAEEEDSSERRRKEEHEEKKKLLYDRWGKGLKQIEAHQNRLLEQQHESSKPLARYSNDEDLERHLKEQERAEDPMLEYMRRKRKEKEKQSGKPQIPRYEGTFPENRFGIRPGYRWDGVDRSNGYEKKYFAVQNEKRARKDEAYKYSVEDM